MLNYKIHGSDIQAVEVTLKPNEAIRAEPGAMMYMQPDIQMNTNVEGGIVSGLKRVFSGENFFITRYNNATNENQQITLAAPYPGKIIPIEIDKHQGAFFCQKSAFLCASQDVKLEITFAKKLAVGFFGGEGFVLQKLSGKGLAFIHAGGAIIEKKLEYNQILKIDTGCLVGFSKTIDYDIKFVGGIKNTIFGGEGMFLATVRGPGIVYLQSLPFSRLAGKILQVAQKGNSDGE